MAIEPAPLGPITPWAYFIGAGGFWPGTNEDLQRGARDGVRDSTAALLAVIEDAHTAASAVTFSIASASAEEFVNAWNSWVAGDESQFGQLVTGLNQVADGLDQNAIDVEHTKLVMNITLLVMAAQILLAILMAPFTDGVSMTEAFFAAFIARETLARIAAWLLDAIIAMVLPDVIAQALQGHTWSTWNWAETAQAGLAAIVAGIAGGYAGKLAGRFVPLLARPAENLGERFLQLGLHSAQGAAVNTALGLPLTVIGDAVQSALTGQQFDLGAAVAEWWQSIPSMAVSGAAMGAMMSAAHVFAPDRMHVTIADPGAKEPLLSGRLEPDGTLSTFTKSGLRNGSATLDGGTFTVREGVSGLLGDSHGVKLEPGQVVTVRDGLVTRTYTVTDTGALTPDSFTTGHGGVTQTSTVVHAPTAMTYTTPEGGRIALARGDVLTSYHIWGLRQTEVPPEWGHASAIDLHTVQHGSSVTWSIGQDPATATRFAVVREVDTGAGPKTMYLRPDGTTEYGSIAFNGKPTDASGGTPVVTDSGAIVFTADGSTIMVHPNDMVTPASAPATAGNVSITEERPGSAQPAIQVEASVVHPDGVETPIHGAPPSTEAGVPRGSGSVVAEPAPGHQAPRVSSAVASVLGKATEAADRMAEFVKSAQAGQDRIRTLGAAQAARAEQAVAAYRDAINKWVSAGELANPAVTDAIAAGYPHVSVIASAEIADLAYFPEHLAEINNATELIHTALGGEQPTGATGTIGNSDVLAVPATVEPTGTTVAGSYRLVHPEPATTPEPLSAKAENPATGEPPPVESLLDRHLRGVPLVEEFQQALREEQASLPGGTAVPAPQHQPGIPLAQADPLWIVAQHQGSAPQPVDQWHAWLAGAAGAARQSGEAVPFERHVVQIDEGHVQVSGTVRADGPDLRVTLDELVVLSPPLVRWGGQWQAVDPRPFDQGGDGITIDEYAHLVVERELVSAAGSAGYGRLIVTGPAGERVLATGVAGNVVGQPHPKEPLWLYEQQPATPHGGPVSPWPDPSELPAINQLTDLAVRKVLASVAASGASPERLPNGQLRYRVHGALASDIPGFDAAIRREHPEMYQQQYPHGNADPSTVVLAAKSGIADRDPHTIPPGLVEQDLLGTGQLQYHEATVVTGRIALPVEFQDVANLLTVMESGHPQRLIAAMDSKQWDELRGLLAPDDFAKLSDLWRSGQLDQLRTVMGDGTKLRLSSWERHLLRQYHDEIAQHLNRVVPERPPAALSGEHHPNVAKGLSDKVRKLVQRMQVGLDDPRAAYARSVDAEAKLIGATVQALRAMPEPPHGTVVIAASKELCPSCQQLVYRAQAEFRDVRFVIAAHDDMVKPGWLPPDPLTAPPEPSTTDLTQQYPPLQYGDPRQLPLHGMGLLPHDGVWQHTLPGFADVAGVRVESDVPQQPPGVEHAGVDQPRLPGLEPYQLPLSTVDFGHPAGLVGVGQHRPNPVLAALSGDRSTGGGVPHPPNEPSPPDHFVLMSGAEAAVAAPFIEMVRGQDGILNIFVHASEYGLPVRDGQPLTFDQLVGELPPPDRIPAGTVLRLLGCDMAQNEELMHHLAEHFGRVVVAADKPVWIDAAGNIVSSTAIDGDLAGPRPRADPDGVWHAALPGQPGLHMPAAEHLPVTGPPDPTAQWHQLLGGAGPPQPATVVEAETAVRLHTNAGMEARSAAEVADRASAAAHQDAAVAASAQVEAAKQQATHRDDAATARAAADAEEAKQAQAVALAASAANPADRITAEQNAARHAAEARLLRARAELDDRQAIRAGLRQEQAKNVAETSWRATAAQQRLATAARERQAAENDVAQHAQRQVRALADLKNARTAATRAPARSAVADATRDRATAQAHADLAASRYEHALREVKAYAGRLRAINAYASLDLAAHDAGFAASDATDRQAAARAAAQQAGTAATTHATEAAKHLAEAQQHQTLADQLHRRAGTETGADQVTTLAEADRQAQLAARARAAAVTAGAAHERALREVRQYGRDSDRFAAVKARQTSRYQRLERARLDAEQSVAASGAEIAHAEQASGHLTAYTVAQATRQAADGARSLAHQQAEAHKMAADQHTVEATRVGEALKNAQIQADDLDRRLRNARDSAVRERLGEDKAREAATELAAKQTEAAREVARHDTVLGAATDQTVMAEAARQKRLAEQQVAALAADQRTALTRADEHRRQAAHFDGRAVALDIELTEAHKAISDLGKEETRAQGLAADERLAQQQAESMAQIQEQLERTATQDASSAQRNTELADEAGDARHRHAQTVQLAAAVDLAAPAPPRRPIPADRWQPPEGSVPLKVRGTDQVVTYRLGPYRYATPIENHGVVTHWEFSQYLPEALADRRLVPAGPLDQRTPSWQSGIPATADQVVVDRSGDVVGYHLPRLGYVRLDRQVEWTVPVASTQPPDTEAIPRTDVAQPDFAALTVASRRVPAGWIRLFDGPEPAGFRDPKGLYYLADNSRPGSFAWKVYASAPPELSTHPVAAVPVTEAVRYQRYAVERQERDSRWSPVWDRYDQRVVAFWDGRHYQVIGEDPRTGELYTHRDDAAATRYRDERYDHRPNVTWKPVRFDEHSGRPVAWQGADIRSPNNKVWLLTHEHVAEFGSSPTVGATRRQIVGIRHVGRLPDLPGSTRLQKRPEVPAGWVLLEDAKTGRTVGAWDGTRFRIFVEDHRTGQYLRTEPRDVLPKGLPPRLRVAAREGWSPVVDPSGRTVAYRTTRAVDNTAAGGQVMHEYVDVQLVVDGQGQGVGVRHRFAGRGTATPGGSIEVPGGRPSRAGWRPPGDWQAYVDQRTGGLGYYRHGDRFIVPKLVDRKVLWLIPAGERTVLERSRALPAHLDDPRYVPLPTGPGTLPAPAPPTRGGALADAWFAAGRNDTTLELHDALRGWNGRGMDRSLRLISALAARRLPGLQDTIDTRLAWPLRPVAGPLLHGVVNPLERLFTGRYHLHYQDSLGGRIEGRLSDLGGYWRSAVVENLPTKLHILDTPRRFLALGSGEATTIQRVHQPRIGTYRTSHGDLYVVLATTDPKITRSFSVTAGERPSLRWGGDWIPGWPGGEGRLPLPGGKADVPWFVDLPYGDRFPDSTASFSVGTPVPLGLDTHVVTREATGQTRLIAVRVNGGHGPAVIHDFVPHDAVPRDQGVPQGRAPWRLAAIGEGAGRIGLSPLAGPSHSLLHNHPLPLPPSQLELPVPSKWPAYFYAKPVIDFGVGGVRAVSIWELAAHLFAGRGQVSLELRGIEVAVGLSLSYNPVLVAQTMLWPLRAVDLLGQTGVVPWGTPVNDLAQAFTRATGGGVTWQWNPELAYVLATQVDLNRPPQPAGGPHVPLPPGHDWQPRREHGQIVGYVDSTAVVLPVRSPVTGEIVEWTEQPVPGGTP